MQFRPCCWVFLFYLTLDFLLYEIAKAVFSASLAIDVSYPFIVRRLILPTGRLARSAARVPCTLCARIHTIGHYSFPFLSMKQDMKLSTKMVKITSSHQRSFFIKKFTRSLNVHFVSINTVSPYCGWRFFFCFCLFATARAHAERSGEGRQPREERTHTGLTTHSSDILKCSYTSGYMKCTYLYIPILQLVRLLVEYYRRFCCCC